MFPWNNCGSYWKIISGDVWCFYKCKIDSSSIRTLWIYILKIWREVWGSITCFLFGWLFSSFFISSFLSSIFLPSSLPPSVPPSFPPSLSPSLLLLPHLFLSILWNVEGFITFLGLNHQICKEWKGNKSKSNPLSPAWRISSGDS